MKQSNVAIWIKGIAIAIGIAGLVFFVFVMPYIGKLFFERNEEIAFLYLPLMIAGGITALFCYAILFQFWKVCLQIEKDNSFSRENERTFHIMSRLLLVLAGLWLLFLLVWVLCGWATFEMVWWMALIIFVFGVIAGLCAALSLLIEKAVTLQEEHELTI